MHRIVRQKSQAFICYYAIITITTRLCSASANLRLDQNLNRKWSRILIQISRFGCVLNHSHNVHSLRCRQQSFRQVSRCRQQSFRQVSQKSAGDCMINANKTPNNFLFCNGEGSEKVTRNRHLRLDKIRSDILFANSKCKVVINWNKWKTGYQSW